MWRIIEWATRSPNYLYIITVLAVLGAVGTLWAYDWDAKCLIAECRRVKE